MNVIYEEIRKYVIDNFTGEEEHRELQKKVARIPKRMRSKIRIAVNPSFSTSQVIEWILRNRTTIPQSICYCSKPIDGLFVSLVKGYRFQEYCSTKCRSNDDKFKNKIASTNTERYGHVNNMWGSLIRETTKKKWQEKFGVDNPMKSKIIQEKAKKTNQEKLGVDWPAQSEKIREKYRHTSLEKFGVDNVFKTSKSKDTNLRLYGVENPMQRPEIFEKTQKYRRKIALWPSGKEFSFQGYENVAVNLMLENGANEEDIKISSPKEIPVIEYWNPVKKKMCHYFPDIWIPKNNLLIEVKSTYTMRKQIEENLAKQQASKKLGFNHEIWVCSKTKLLEIY